MSSYFASLVGGSFRNERLLLEGRMSHCGTNSSFSELTVFGKDASMKVGKVASPEGVSVRPNNLLEEKIPASFNPLVCITYLRFLTNNAVLNQRRFNVTSRL